ncbi:MAG: argininosuccinate lyase [Pyrinomonadaceae bacterium]
MTENNDQRSGRFAPKRDETFAEFNNSFKFDRKLFQADIEVNIAYCEVLFHAGVLTRLESERIRNGLQAVLKRAEFDKSYLDEMPSPDIHTFVELRLIQLIGDTGRKLLTGKSRIDQAATVFRLWLRKEIEGISVAAADFQSTLIDSAENNQKVVLPGFNQSKKTAPILWGHWCLAYFEMIARDLERFDEVWRRVNVMPFGSGDLAGNAFEIDREEMAEALGFEGISPNSLDAVSDRDFAAEFVGACALLMVHLSRLAEDLILFSAPEFGFVRLGDPDSEERPTDQQAALELIRGKAGRVFGHQTALLTLLKGLPLAYQRDLQEDKEAVFDTIETVKGSLRMARTVLRKLDLNEEKARLSALDCNSQGTELADYLIHRGVSFGTAQETVGKIVNYAGGLGKKLRELTLEDLRKFSADFEEDALEVLSLERMLSNKDQIGGTSPERVSEALKTARETLERENTGDSIE